MTVDHHQPPRRRPRPRQAQSEVSGRAEAHGRLQADSRRGRARRRAGGSGRCSATPPISISRSPRPSGRPSACRASFGRLRSSRRGARSFSSASRLIEELRKGQTGPVHLLDHISKSLPESMWLTDLASQPTTSRSKGDVRSLNALSDFVSALEASNLFERPIEIIDSRVEEATADDARIDPVFGTGASTCEGGRLMALVKRPDNVVTRAWT